MSDKEHVYETCTFCKGEGKLPKTKKIRMWCDECHDKGHSCFGSGKKKKGRELGHSHCCTTEYVYK